MIVLQIKAGGDQQPGAWPSVGARCQLTRLRAALPPTAGPIACWQWITLSSPGSCSRANPADRVCHIPADASCDSVDPIAIHKAQPVHRSDPVFLLCFGMHVCRFAPEHMNNFMPTWLP